MNLVRISASLANRLGFLKVAATPNLFAALACSVGLAACALPDEALPSSSLRNHTSHGGASFKTSAQASPSLPGGQAKSVTPAAIDSAPVGDVHLKQCLGLALSNNLSVKMAGLDARASQAGIRVAQSAFDPSLDLVGGEVSNGSSSEGNAVIKKRFATGTEVRAEAGTLFFDNSDRTEGTTTPGTDYALRIRQSLLRGASMKANLAPVEKARLVAANADANTRIQIYEMLRAAESAYWTGSFAASLEQAQKEGLERIRNILSIIEQRKAAGAGTKLDVLEAEAAVARAEDAVVGAQKRKMDSLEQLWFVMGYPPQVPNGVQLRHLDEAVAVPAGVNASDRYAAARSQSPEVILLANDIRGRELGETVARNRLLPRVDAEFNWGSSSFISSSNSSTTGNGDQWSALLRVSIPWTFREERAQLDIARAELSRSRIAQENGMRMLEKGIHETCREISSAHQELEAAMRGAKANRTKFAEQRLRYETGVASVRDLMEAETELRAAESRQLEAHLHLVLASVLLARQDGTILDRHHLIL